MTAPGNPRAPGRPPGGKRLISRAMVIEGALALLERGGVEAVTMRALARRLGVDPMAVYHYFRDRDAMLRAAAASAYSGLDVAWPPRARWQKRVLALATTYLTFLRRSGELLRYVSARRHAAVRPTRSFDEHLQRALAPLSLSPRRYVTVRGALVDFLHGYSLALQGRRRGPPQRLFRAELSVVLAGIEAVARRSTP